MIRNKKTTSKLMSLLSALVAVVMLTTTVFASGVLSDMTTADYRIEMIDIDGNVIELQNKPIIYYGEVYVPLREMLEKTTEYPPYISWNDGVIDIAIFRDPHEKGFIRIDADDNGQYGHIAGDSAFYRIEIGLDMIALEHFHKEEFNDFISGYDNLKNKDQVSMYEAPVLINGTTYISLKDINYMLYGFLNRWEPGENYKQGYAEYDDEEITYKIYDKNGEEISLFDTTQGLMIDGISSDYRIDVKAVHVDINFEHQPYFANGRLYLPMFETLEKGKIADKISYNSDGTVITMNLASSEYIYDKDSLRYNYIFEIGKSEITIETIPTVENGPKLTTTKTIRNAPFLVNGVPYISYSTLNSMIATTFKSQKSIGYSLYDADGNIIADDTFKKADMITEPLKNFLTAFRKGDFEEMKKYCTPDCSEKYLADDSFFGRKSVYSNGFTYPKQHQVEQDNITVITHSTIGHDENNNPIYFYFNVYLQKQNDGSYLISDFSE